jgi:hypothetical protein
MTNRTFFIVGATADPTRPVETPTPPAASDKQKTPKSD